MLGAVSPPARGRGLKQCTQHVHAGGAWIETGRGVARRARLAVAPRAGAWIETPPWASWAACRTGRPPRGGVD